MTNQHDKSTGAEAVRHRILMITYAFPPTAYVGGFRTLKYCKYLRDHGWLPIVLTIDPKDVAHRDEKLLDQLPNYVEVYRTYDVDPAKWSTRKTTTVTAQESAQAASSIKKESADQRQPGRVKAWIKNVVKTMLMDSPDSHIFWVPFAIIKGTYVLIKHKVDVIYCSSPPHSSHLIAFVLGKIFRKPYILDFRDPWDVHKVDGDTNFIVRGLYKLEAATKRLIIRSAAKVISATQGERDELKNEFPKLEDSRFSFITNGYDPVDFEGIAPISKISDKLYITHAGTIYSGVGKEFFAALEQIINEDPQIVTALQIQLLGEKADEYNVTVSRLIAEGLIKDYGLQPHEETLKFLLGSDVLLILRGGLQFKGSHIPAKVFEYMGIGKPILAITSEGGLSEIIERCQHGIIVPPNSVARVKECILDLCARHKDNQLHMQGDKSYLKTFERESLTRELAMQLNSVVEIK